MSGLSSVLKSSPLSRPKAKGAHVKYLPKQPPGANSLSNGAANNEFIYPEDQAFKTMYQYLLEFESKRMGQNNNRDQFIPVIGERRRRLGITEEAYHPLKKISQTIDPVLQESETIEQFDLEEDDSGVMALMVVPNLNINCYGVNYVSYDYSP